MRFIIDRSAARLAIAVVCVALVSGCGGQAADSTAAREATASTLPPTTTIPPLTVEEVDWLDEVDKLPEKMENAYKEIPPLHDLRPRNGGEQASHLQPRVAEDRCSQRPAAAGLCAGEEGVRRVRQGGAMLHRGRSWHPAG